MTVITADLPLSASGGCLCGAVTFTMAFPSKTSAHCHCSLCRRAHGAAFVTWVSVEAAQVAVQDPEHVLKWFSSSGEAQRGFCSRCGSNLFLKSGNWPSELHIARANFVDPVDCPPQLHGYYDLHVDWYEVNDDLPKRSAPSHVGPS